MSFLTGLGRKLNSAGRFLGKKIGQGAKLGQKLFGNIDNTMSTIEGIPIAGSMVKGAVPYWDLIHQGAKQGKKYSDVASKVGNEFQQGNWQKGVGQTIPYISSEYINRAMNFI